MPRQRWTPPERPVHPEAAAFVQRVMAELGLDGPRDLARALGYGGLDDDRKFYRYASGQNKPPFDLVMEMLQAVGWLQDGSQKASEPTSLDAIDEKLEQTLAELKEIRAAEDNLREHLLDLLSRPGSVEYLERTAGHRGAGRTAPAKPSKPQAS